MLYIDRRHPIVCFHEKTWTIMLLIFPLFLPCVHSFGNSILHARNSAFQISNEIIQRSFTSYPLAVSSNDAGDFSIEGYLEASKEKLLWEVLREKERRPVLNLSARDLSPEEVSTQDEENSNVDSSNWESGETWKATQNQLAEIGLFSSAKDDTASSNLLQSVPQLLRLDTDMVTETAKVLLKELKMPPTLLLKDSPKLLSFPPDDVRYGVEFLSLMMMMPTNLVIQTCQSAPALLVGGVEGGLNEQAVKNALGAAAAATSSANNRIAADAVATLDQLRNKNTPKGL